MPRREIIQKVFAISPSKKTYGSCLAYPACGVVYLITASHVIKSMTHAVESELQIYKDNQWHSIKATPYFSKPLIDIAVIKTSIEATYSPEIELSAAGSVLGQDVYFLGFPYFGEITYLAESLNKDFPLPLVKKANLSSMPCSSREHFYLDGHNNPGFSGGPVTFWDSKTNKQKVLGIVSGYLNHLGGIKQIETSSQLFYQENSGIAVAYNIQYAKNIIDQLSS